MIEENFKDSCVMVTGACGTVGAELVRQLAGMPVRKIVCVDNNESELFFLIEKYKKHNVPVVAHLSDIRDLESLKLRMQGVDIVLHSAALKHVGLCEDSPNQAIETNIKGTQNIIDAAIASGVKRVVFTSSDKAVNPTNVMGTSKLMGERLMTAANESYADRDTIFSSTRFGNVMGSRGSVIPLFRQQIEQGGPITLTDPKMTRFIMTLEEAARLVLESVWHANGGEVMVMKMPIARIEDIAMVMRDALSPDTEVPIEIIGAKPGEKMYEELMNDEEVRRAYDNGQFFVILSAFADKSDPKYKATVACPQPDRPYNSSHEETMTLEETRAFFKQEGIV